MRTSISLCSNCLVLKLLVEDESNNKRRSEPCYCSYRMLVQAFTSEA